MPTISILRIVIKMKINFKTNFWLASLVMSIGIFLVGCSKPLPECGSDESKALLLKNLNSIALEGSHDQYKFLLLKPVINSITTISKSNESLQCQAHISFKYPAMVEHLTSQPYTNLAPQDVKFSIARNELGDKSTVITLENSAEIIRIKPINDLAWSYYQNQHLTINTGIDSRKFINKPFDQVKNELTTDDWIFIGNSSDDKFSYIFRPKNYVADPKNYRKSDLIISVNEGNSMVYKVTILDGSENEFID